MEKGSITMRVAVTYEDGEVFQHFGHCAQFKLYDVDYNAVGKSNYEGSSESEQASVDRMLDIFNRDLSESEKKKLFPVVEFLKINPVITKQDVIGITGRAESTAKRYLNLLIDINILVKEGDSVATIYRRI